MLRSRGKHGALRATLALALLSRARDAAADEPSHAADARAPSALAAPAADEPERDPDEVTVRGHGAGGFVSEARLDDATREVTDAASLIEPLPGVHIRRLGADDSFATLSVRGTSSTQVAVYLAGVPLSGGADPTLDIATLPLWPGARARVYRSFAPAALGRGSLGGTLVLDTPSPRAAARTEIYTAVGAYGSRRVRIGDVRGEPDGVRLATGFSASRSDDDFSYVDQLASRNGRDGYATRENAGHAAASGLASLALPVRLGPGNVGALTLTTLAQVRRQELPATLGAKPLFERLATNRLLAALELSLPAGPGAVVTRAWGRREGLALHGNPAIEASSGALRGASETNDAVVAAGGSLGWRGRPSEATTLDARLDASGERFAPGTWVGATAPAGAARTNAGAGVDASWQALPPLTLAASARADTWFDRTDDGGTTSEARPTGNLGLTADVGPVVLATHGGVLARPASFVERFGNRGAFIGNADLKPESATTVDLGGTLDRTLAKVVRLHLELAGFATWAEDLIVFVPAGAYARAKSTNIGRARLLGTEASLRLAAFGLELRLSHTALATANESECRASTGPCERPSLLGRPAHDFVGDLGATLGPVRVRYGVDAVTGIQADLKGDVSVPARVLHSAGARLDVPGVPGLTLSVDVRNLFNLRAAEYPNAVGGTDRLPIGDLFEYPIPGRRLLLSARWVFPEPGASASVRASQ